MANMVGNTLCIRTLVPEHERLYQLRAEADRARASRKDHFDSAPDPAKLAFGRYREELNMMESRELRALLEFAAGVLREGCGALLPIADEPSPEEQAQWKAILTEAYPDRKDSYDSLLHLAWCVHQWGCSNIMPEGLAVEVHSRTELRLGFETKWTPPLKWVEEIARQHPEWRIVLDSHDAEEGLWDSRVEWDGERWTEKSDDRREQPAEKGKEVANG